MTEYRLFFVNGDNHTAGMKTINCADDLSALEAAQVLLDGLDIEIWDGMRLIVRVEPDSNARLPLRAAD